MALLEEYILTGIIIFINTPVSYGTMTQLTEYFDDYLKKEPLFVNRDVFKGNFSPETINHRDEEIKSIAKIMAPILRTQKPSNLFIYGKNRYGQNTLC